MNQRHSLDRIAIIAFIRFIYTGSYTQSNYAVSFHGADDHVSVPHNAALNVTNFSFEVWINLSTTSGALTICRKEMKRVPHNQLYL